MKIVITGGAGFIGSNLAEELAKKHELVVVDDRSTGRAENVEGSRVKADE
jgi:UDP-glucose 4-epimerase